MKRRDVLMAGAGVFGTAVAGAGGAVALTSIEVGGQDDSGSAETVDNASPEAEAARPLAVAFTKHIRTYYPNARVFINPKNGYLSMEFQSKSGSAGEVQKEFHRIAVEYVRVMKEGDHEPNTISFITSNVKATVTEPAVTAHIEGEINQEAFLKTIEVNGVERRTESGAE